jgi:lipid-binding SYLF domain-containing protein
MGKSSTDTAKKVYVFATTALYFTLIFGSFLTGPSYAATAKEIDVSVDVALERFYKKVKGGKEFAKIARGLLVLPNVKKAAFIIGGEYGQGSLRIGERTVDYYNIVSGSVG